MLISISIQADQKTYQAYTETQIAPYYADKDRVIFNGQTVQPGDVLVLETGEEIIFKKYLGQGYNSLVIEDQRGFAVRLSLFFGQEQLDHFHSYFMSQNELAKVLPKVNLVQLIWPEFKSLYAIKVETLKISTLLTDFVLTTPDLSDEPRFHELMVFFKHYSGVEKNNDFHPDQLAYVNGRGWVLLDFGNEVRLNREGQKTPLERIISLFRKEKPYVYHSLSKALKEYESAQQCSFLL